MPHRRRLATLFPLALAAAAAAGCATGAESETGATAGAEPALTVIAGFYPLEYAAEQVGGDRVDVTNLTPPGAHAHDLELTPRDVARVAEADLVVYERLMQPAVDEMVSQQPPAHVLEVGQAADLTLTAGEAIGADPGAHDHAHDGPQSPGNQSPGADAHGHNDHGHDAPDPGATDPHFWLDPTRYDAVAQQIAARLGEIDPGHAADYAANARRLSDALSGLDAEYRAGLHRCASRDLVTSHAAFGYLADRYDLTQVPIAGLSPDAEPASARLAQIADFVRTNDVGTVYTEPLVSPAIAETITAETGATTAVLDPLESLTDASPGADYPAIMRANLATLRTGQECS